MATRKIKEKTLLKKLGKFVSVENTESRNGHGYAPNQFKIKFEKGEVFQSYATLVGVHYNGEYYFSDAHDYSNSTSSHCGWWCGHNCNERRKGLANGTFVKIVA